MKFIHLSPPTADFSSELQSQLRILNGNILYITREVDKLMVITRGIQTNLDLKQQTLEFYDEKEETSPQTDSDEQ